MARIEIEYLQLVTQHQQAIYGYIRSLAPGADIDDILQETNLVLWEKAATFRRGSNFKAFAFRIAHLKTLEALRARRRRSWLVFDSDILDALSAAEEPHEADETVAVRRALRVCMEKLPEDDRTLIHARYTRRETVRGIAARLGRSEGALQQVFFRIRNQLRECILRSTSLEGGEA